MNPNIAKAQKHFDRNELSQALHWLRKTAMTPNKREYITRYSVYQAVGLYDLAEKSLNVVCAGEDLSDSILLLSYGSLESSRADYPKAEQYYAQAVESSQRGKLNIRQSAPLILLGSSLGRQGKLDQALNCYQKATELPVLENDIDEAWANVGFVQRAKGNLRRAQEAFQNAERLGYDAAAERTDIDAALAYQRNPKEMTLGECMDLFYDEKYAQALACIEHHYQSNFSSSPVISEYAEVLIWLRRFDDVELLIDRLTSPEVFEHTKLVHLRMSERLPPEPWSDPLKTLRNEELCLRAMLETFRGNHAAAIEIHSEALQSMPKNTRLSNSLGNAYLKQGKLIDAAECFQATLDKSETDQSAHEGLARISRMLGCFADAADHFYAAAGVASEANSFIACAKDAEVAALRASESNEN